MKPSTFRVTEDHLKLLRRMSIGWEHCEYGAPAVDCKRPYGNSYVEGDVAEILEWEIDPDDGLTDEQRDRAAELHGEMEVVLQIAVHCASLTPGRYRNVHHLAPYGVEYELKDDTGDDGPRAA